MAVLPILRWPDVRLATRCMPVGPVDDATARLASDMLETMYAAPGRGLAAPQVGVLRRIFVLDTTWKEGTRSPRVCIDPDILWMSDTRAEGPEGCLSIPGVTMQVRRAQAIRLRWTGLDGKLHEQELHDFDAICAQHEFDHLDGIVIFDRISPEARARALSEYET